VEIKVPSPSKKGDFFLHLQWDTIPHSKHVIFPPRNEKVVQKANQLAEFRVVWIDGKSKIEIKFLIDFLGSLIIGRGGVNKRQGGVASDKWRSAVIWLNYHGRLLVIRGIDGSLGCHGRHVL
jgi:hypothetical protein